MRFLLAAAVLLLLAGCTTPAATTPGTTPPPPAPPRTSVLDGALEPAAFAAPTFKLLGPVTTGSAAYSVGEPSIRAALDGRLLVSFPGCDNGGSILVGALPGQASCAHGPVFGSSDNGTTWKRYNDPATGKLANDAPDANGDAEIAVDGNGTIYASDLGTGIVVQSSSDGGATWKFIGNVVPKNEGADRQWMAAAGPGHLIMAWMGSLGNKPRSVLLNTTFDGGATWTGIQALGDNIGWIGPVAFAPDGVHAYVVYTQPTGQVQQVPFVGGSQTCSVMVGRSDDGGRTWAPHDTGASITTNIQGQHWSCVNMAPALDVTGDGHVVAAWSEDVESAMDVTAQGAVVKAVVGDATAGNWTKPFALTTEATAIMPWVAGGAGQRFEVTYFSSNVPLDPDYAGTTWDLKSVVVANATTTPRFARATIDTDVHEGGICSQGGGCFTDGSDRFLLDFFQNDVMPDGRLVVVYPANPASQERSVEIRVAIQSGGTPLLQRSA